jgi:hypothetical protein
LPSVFFSYTYDGACSSDGTYRYVVGYTNPGVPNNYNFERYRWNGSGFLVWLSNIGGDIPVKQATCVACSADGLKLAVGFGGVWHAPDYIYTSTNAGSSWTQRLASGSRAWSGIASSADGLKLAACVYGEYIYTSTDQGVTWTARIAAGSRTWTSIASSADGLTLVASVGGFWPNPGGYVYISTDGGASWTEDTSIGQGCWNAVACSSNAQTMLIARSPAGWAVTPLVLLSINGGATWKPQSLPFMGWPDNIWKMSCSSDGRKMSVANAEYAWLYNQ